MKYQPANADKLEFAEFLRLWKNNSSKDPSKDYSHYIKSNPLVENILSLGPCFMYMLDYREMKYLYMTSSMKNILGFDIQEVMEAGPAYFHQRIHPDDMKELMTIHFPKILDFFYSLDFEERKKVRCAYDYRVRRVDGKYTRLLQQTMVLDIDSEGKPLADIGIVSDITDYKKTNQITLSLSRYDQEMGFISPELTNTKVVNAEEKPDRISERELEILKLLMQGYSSKKIADELHISINTVRNHRQNLLEKTKTKNIAELITFALSNSLI